MEPVRDFHSLKNGTIVSALVRGSGTTLKYFYKKGSNIVLQAANQNYEDISLSAEQVEVQGRLIAVWRKA